MKFKNNKIKLKNKNLISFNSKLIIKTKNDLNFDVFIGNQLILENVLFVNNNLEFSNNFIIFKKNRKAGFIKDDGFIIDAIFDDVYNFKNNTAVVYKYGEGMYIINEKGEIISDKYQRIKRYDKYFKFNSNRYEGLLNQDGKILIDSLDEVDEFSEGFCRFRKLDKVGLINSEFQIVLSDLSSCSKMKNGVVKFKKNDKYGFMNKDGIIIDNLFYLDEFYEGLAVFQKDGKEGWIDSSGNIIGFGFEKCFDFKDGIGYFLEKNRCKKMDKFGKRINFFYNLRKKFERLCSY